MKKQPNRFMQSYKTGKYAEWVGIFYLLMKGYWPLVLRYGGKGGEIDLIAKRGRTIIFVEIKWRQTHYDAACAISTHKQQLIRRKVKHWMAHNSWAVRHILRADALLLGKTFWPVHIAAAFELYDY
jgi:putative endonuclease